jgi:hypothetical protein
VKVLLFGALLCGAMFVAGLAMPERSRGAQRWVGKKLRRGERRAGRRRGRVRDFARGSLRQLRGASDKSADTGRDTRSKLPV